MILPMITSSLRSFSVAGIALFSLMLVTGCDGGIFGTGGPDQQIDNTTLDGSAGVSDSTPDGIGVDAGTTDTGTTDTGTSGAETNMTGTTDGGTDDAGTTDGNSQISEGGTDNGSVDAGSPGFEEDQIGSFSNDTPALNSTDPKLNVINTTNKNLNVLDESLDANSPLFTDNGVPPLSASASVTLDRAVSVLRIVDNNNRSMGLYWLDTLTAAPATLTTLVIREVNNTITVVPLATETTTTDPMLARVRVVQGIVLQDEAALVTVSALSAGDNPGGIDVDFDAVSFTDPSTAYKDLPAGDYDIMDDLGSLAVESITLMGGNAYTLVLVGDDTRNRVLVVNDTQAAQ